MPRLLLIGILAAGTAFGQGRPRCAKSLAPGAIANNNSDCVLSAGDAIAIEVWRETDISGPKMIRPNGKFTYPLIGEVQAAGLSPHELVADLTFRLSKYVNDPRITIRIVDRSKE